MFFAPGILAETPGDRNNNNNNKTQHSQREYSQLCCEQL